MDEIELRDEMMVAFRKIVEKQCRSMQIDTSDFALNNTFSSIHREVANFMDGISEKVDEFLEDEAKKQGKNLKKRDKKIARKSA